MIYVICILAAILFAGATVQGRGYQGPWRYRGAEWLLDQGKRRGWKKPEWMSSRLLLQAWLMVMAGSVFLAGAVWKQDREKKIPVESLERPGWDEERKEEKMLLEWQKEDGKTEKKEIMVTVGQEQITAEQRKEVFQRAEKQLDEEIFCDGISADRVERSLALPEELPDSGISVSWESSRPEYLDWMGQLGEDIPEEGVAVRLTGTMMLQEKEELYQRDLMVYPEKYTGQEELQYCLEQASEAKNPRMVLPGEIQGQKLVWKRAGDRSEITFGMFLLVSPAFLFLIEKQKAADKEKKEKQQLLQDYPEIVSKLTLLLCAGMNLRKAMERIGNDYLSWKKPGEERKAYQMIVDLCREMTRGVPEKMAYERIGEKCGLLCYRTLSALLVQHLQKGSAGLGRMLEDEVRNAQLQRQQQAKILGEQASTKLLIPMIMMLLIVFVILLVPLWLTFM